ncbi:hypothetical protein [Lactobacillus sp. CBA3606]|nr:hypothetical protein [Lactobacillus sp. CBA3606]
MLLEVGTLSSSTSLVKLADIAANTGRMGIAVAVNNDNDDDDIVF